MKRGLDFVQNRSRSAVLAAAVVLLALLGWIDVWAGRNVTLFPFYGLPIALVAFRMGDKAGVGMAFAAGAIWWSTDVMVDQIYPSYGIRAWETTIRFLFFILVAFGVDAMTRAHRAAIGRIALLEHSAQLEHEVVEISEYEQRRIGRDLHDGLCQSLAAAECVVAGLESKLAARSTADLASEASVASRLINSAISEARNLARGLVVIPAGDAPLESLLEELAESTQNLLGIQCAFSATGRTRLNAATDGAHLFRIAQEAVSNAHKHGGARRIEISLSANPEVTILSIADDGRGFCGEPADHRGMGLNTMRYRAKIIGGELTLEKRERGGTIVSCMIHHSRHEGELNAAA